jgi:hypothetical protein
MTKSTRLQELNKLSKAQLVQMYRTGIKTQDGHVIRYGWSEHPPETWRKDELVYTVLHAEFS